MHNRLTSLRHLLLLVFVTLSGCVVLPLHHDSIEDPALLEIRTAFARTVEQTLNDPEQQWTSGWLGNMWINFHGDDNRGLCYEWKYRVHAGVQETVQRVGWQATAIVINRGAAHEHHAVVVYDPAQVSAGKLLAARPSEPVYILDAWRQGQADIYTMHDWLQLPMSVSVAAEIIPVQAPR
ncbi:hypothetical protein [Sulfuriflexus sp.]|uniref:hypothetical protein n=1 Tax=Sulfuriflexus sp. TaxID=2015443 RepID=UPI0028CE8270|nr:hypothetical protein [Sulfuriflexus sp.]MDT8404309.1 hypothetical protein [Sulfuriflexus sp.]